MDTPNTTPGSKAAPLKNMVTLTRVFRFGSISLPDPDPSLSPEEVVKLYVPNYPLLEMATIGEPYVEGENMAYPLNRQEVKTKG